MVPKRLLGYGISTIALLLASCGTAPDPTPAPGATPLYLTISSNPDKESPPDHLRVVFSDGTSVLQSEHDNMYMPEFTRYYGYVALPDHNNIKLFNENGNEVKTIPKPAYSMHTAAATSPTEIATAFQFKDGHVALLFDDHVTVAVPVHTPTALTACDDGTAYWIEHDFDTESSTFVQLTARGEVTRRELPPDTSGLDAQFTCSTNTLEMYTGIGTNTARKIVIEDPLGEALAFDFELTNPLHVSEIGATGFSPAGFFSFHRDGSYQLVPPGSLSVVEGQFEIEGLSLSDVFIHGDAITVVAGAPDKDTQLFTFDPSNLTAPIQKVTIAGSSKNADTRLKEDYIGPWYLSSAIPI